MRGVRGGLKDQIKAFREFLLKRKKKKKKQEQLLKLKKKKADEKKKQIFFDYEEFVSEKLDKIVLDIYNDIELNYAKINNELDIMKKDKNNISLFDKIEEVKEKVEVEVLYEEIIHDNVVLLNSKDIKTEDNKKQKFERFIYLSTKNINKSDDVKEINHYYNRVYNLYDKHVSVQNENQGKKQNKVLEISNDLDNYIEEDKKLLLLSDNKLKVINKQEKKLFNKQNDIILEPSNLEFILDEIIEVDTYDNNFDKSSIIVDVLDDDSAKIKIEKTSNHLIDFKDYSEKIINDEISSDKANNSDINHEEFSIINQVNIAQIMLSEKMVNKIRTRVVHVNDQIDKLSKQIEKIDDLFKEKSFIDKIFDFSSNLFNLGRGLLGKYVFSNKLVGRLNNEMLINNSLKGIHRLFVDDKKEVPYVVFKSFEDDINSKKDCIEKIYDICDDSLTEIINLRCDFFKKYGGIDTEEVRNFLKRINECEKQIECRKEEIKRIQKKVQQKYEKNRQLVKVKK